MQSSTLRIKSSALKITEQHEIAGGRTPASICTQHITKSERRSDELDEITAHKQICNCDEKLGPNGRAQYETRADGRGGNGATRSNKIHEYLAGNISARHSHPTRSRHSPTSGSDADSLQWAISVEDVAAQGDKISLRKAYGSDNIHPSFIRHGGNALHRALHYLFTYSYEHSTIPQQWTESLVVPIYKKEGDAAKAESYRPISLTSCVMRTMEHLIQNKLLPHVSPQLHDSQYGFRPQHSTYNAIYELTQYVHLKAKRPKAATPVAFLDLRKAFDRVWRRWFIP
jgi:hypothetical protein